MSWDIVNLGTISITIMGQAPPSSHCNKEGNGIPFVKAGEFALKRPIIREWTTKPLKLAEYDDVLLCVVGATSGKVNRGIDCAIGRSVAAIRVKKSFLNTDFLYYFIKSWTSRLRSMSQGAAQTVITKEMISNLKIPLPPLPVQERIAAILDAADALRQKDQQLLKKYDDLTQSLFLDMFGDPVTNPKGWDMIRLDEFCEFENGDRSSNYPSGNDIKSHGKLFLSSGDIKNGRFIVKDSKFISTEKFLSLKRGKCYRNDVLMTLRGNGTGKSAIFDCEYDEGFINAQMVILRPSQICNSNYLVYQLNNPVIFKRLINLNSGSAQPQLSAKSVKEFSVFVPPIKYQDLFTSIILAIQDQKKQVQANIKKSEDLFQSLLQKAFKGELVSEENLIPN